MNKLNFTSCVGSKSYYYCIDLRQLSLKKKIYFSYIINMNIFDSLQSVS